MRIKIIISLPILKEDDITIECFIISFNLFNIIKIIFNIKYKFLFHLILLLYNYVKKGNLRFTITRVV
jgi:hypothetical protein